jgi:hypothetical protein
MGLSAAELEKLRSKLSEAFDVAADILDYETQRRKTYKHDIDPAVPTAVAQTAMALLELHKMHPGLTAPRPSDLLRRRTAA